MTKLSNKEKYFIKGALINSEPIKVIARMLNRNVEDVEHYIDRIDVPKSQANYEQPSAINFDNFGITMEIQHGE